MLRGAIRAFRAAEPHATRAFSTHHPVNAPQLRDYISELSSRREVSPTRALIPLMRIPGMISLGTGLPNAKCVRQDEPQ